MSDEKKGTDWNREELDIIVADYFDMLTAELSGQDYFKSKHNSEVAARIGRTHGSIEFKHQNISAVLEKLGLPWILGYKPRWNYQGAILDAIDRYLSKNNTVMEIVPTDKKIIKTVSNFFVNPPNPAPGEADTEQFHHLLRKFDPVERDRLNRALGKAGEEFVFEVERELLSEMGRKDLSSKVKWVAATEGDGAGFDILSFDPKSDREKLIEVKTTNGAARTPFFISRNEYATAKERPSDWCIYRVHLFAREPRIFTISPPLESAINLRPETWRASF
ncbi:MAG: protein NO VEIN domain-containing protein [Leptospirales bacterium]